MPITQDRMLRLLESAERCRDCYVALRQAVMNAGPHGLSLQELMLHAQADAPGYDSIAVIADERARWRANHLKNNSEALRMARKRAEAKGIPLPAPPAPFHETPPAILPDAFDPPSASEFDYEAFKREQAEQERLGGRGVGKNGMPLG